jgi:hypothetical protein
MKGLYMKTLIMLCVGLFFAATNVKINGTFQALCSKAAQEAGQCVCSHLRETGGMVGKPSWVVLNEYKVALLSNPNPTVRGYITKLVNDLGIDVKTYSLYGEPLLISFLRDHELTEFFLQKGACPDAKCGIYSRTSLHWAVRHPSIAPSTLSLLLQRNATVNARDRDNNTPLHLLVDSCALYESKPDTLLEKAELLIEKGALLTTHNKEGQTPLQTAQDTVKKTSLWSGYGKGAEPTAKIIACYLKCAQSQGLKELLP